jgi:hypothetical protein
MAKLEIEGRQVEVDDSFLQLSPEQQAETVEEIAQSLNIQASSKAESRSGSFLPITRDADGVHFDSDVGIVGAIKRGLTLPGDAYKGNVDLGSDEAIGRTLDLAGIAVPASPATRSRMAVLSRQKPGKVKTPTAKELKAAYKGTIDEIKDEGVEYSTQSIKNLSQSIQQKLATEKGIGDEAAPATYSILRKLENSPDEAVGVPFTTGLHSATKQFGLHSSKPNINYPADSGAAAFSSRAIMDYLEKPPQGSVIAGKSKETLGPRLKRANANYSAGKRSDMLRGLDESAELRAAAANSGHNIGNTIRQRVAGLLDNKGSARDRAGFTKNELQGLEDKVVRGSIAANTARDISNLLGGGGGVGQGLTMAGSGGAAGMMTGDPLTGLAVGGAAFGIGRGSRTAANALTKRALAKADKATRQRSPLYQERATATPNETYDFDGKAIALRQQILQLMGQLEELEGTNGGGGR